MAAKELDALNRNMTSIKSIIKNDLHWFSDELVKRNFLVRREIQAVLGTGGITPEDQASKLMDRVYNLMELVENKRELFNEFVDIFKCRGGVASAELVKKLNDPSTNANNAAASDCQSKPTPPRPPVSIDPLTNTTSDDTAVRSKSSFALPPVSIELVDEVETEIRGFHNRFSSLKKRTIDGLNKCFVTVKMVVFILTNIYSLPQHLFLEEEQKKLRDCEDHLELFGSLNFRWNYLAYELLDHLITELEREHQDFKAVAGEMTLYKKDLEKFRKRTTLVLFCEADACLPDKDPPENFKKVVVKFEWTKSTTLEDLEIFRKKYARGYNLPTCAMMLYSIRRGSFMVTWFVPASIVETLRRIDGHFFEEFNIISIEIAGVCFYKSQHLQKPISKPTKQGHMVPVSTKPHLQAQHKTVATQQHQQIKPEPCHPTPVPLEITSSNTHHTQSQSSKQVQNQTSISAVPQSQPQELVKNQRPFSTVLQFSPFGPVQNRRPISAVPQSQPLDGVQNPISAVPQSQPLDQRLVSAVTQSQPQELVKNQRPFSTVLQFTPFGPVQNRRPISAVPQSQPPNQRLVSAVPQSQPPNQRLVSAVPQSQPLDQRPVSAVPQSQPLDQRPVSAVPQSQPLDQRPVSAVPQSQPQELVKNQRPFSTVLQFTPFGPVQNRRPISAVPQPQCQDQVELSRLVTAPLSVNEQLQLPLPNQPQLSKGRSQESPQPIPKEWEEVMQQSLSDGNLDVSCYSQKFHTLLQHEEKAHSSLLQKRCDRKYEIHLFQTGMTPEKLRSNLSHRYARYGYIKGMDGDNISYATQSASSVVIELKEGIECDILAENMYHTEERLYVGFDQYAAQSFLSQFNTETQRSAFNSPKLLVKFRLKFSYFESLKSSIKRMNDNPDVLSRIIPNLADFEPVRGDILSSSDDQSDALRKIAAAPQSGPPILISGPFGTGKTHVLALAAHQFFLQNTEERRHILVCTQMQSSADAYLKMYLELANETDKVRVVRLMPNYYSQGGIYARNVQQFNKEMDHYLHRRKSNKRYIIITTCLTAQRITDVIPPGFFTHIFLDEGAQMREPEAVAPLCMAGPNTKIVIAGDKFQVGPAILVLGDKPQRYGLAVSLLERLYNLYQELGDVAEPYYAHLSTNYRCHRGILTLAHQVAYKETLKSAVSDDVAHPNFPFPLRFICTSLDHEVTETKESICGIEVDASLKEASEISARWPFRNWDERDLSQICFLSPCRRQVTIARGKTPSKYRHIQKMATYTIQGREFRALFISTSEPTYPNSETKDPTKSISDPSVFITAITRAKSLVVAVGNPFMLLKREEHMVKKFGDRGHCWSRFLKACIENRTFSVYPGVAGDTPAMHHLLKKRITLCLSEDKAQERELFTSIPNDSKRLTKPPRSSKTGETKDSVELPKSQQYVYEDKLGAGGFGVVYSAQLKRPMSKEEHCAIKIVKIPVGPGNEEKVMREVRALEKLMKGVHPNIIDYYDSWKETVPPNWQEIAPWNLETISNLRLYYKKSRPCGDPGNVTKHQESNSTQRSQDSGILTEGSSASSTQKSTAGQRLNVKQTGRLSDEPSRSLTRDSGIEGKSSTYMKPKFSTMQRLKLETTVDQVPLNFLFIKTELCQKTLKLWLVENKSRERKKVASFFIEMLKGVKYIHRKGLIHRDLKPSNIFFSLNDWKIKIGDFGQVTNAQDADYDDLPTMSHYVGTSFYISPEQKNGEKYGKEVDIYALGIIYFEMTCTFGKGNREKILNELCGTGEFPKGFVARFPHEANVIREMLREKDERPSAEKLSSSASMENIKKISRNSGALIPSAMY